MIDSHALYSSQFPPVFPSFVCCLSVRARLEFVGTDLHSHSTRLDSTHHPIPSHPHLTPPP